MLYQPGIYPTIVDKSQGIYGHMSLFIYKADHWISPTILGKAQAFEKFALEKKQDVAHEPECSHIEQFCETRYLNSLVFFPPITVPVYCRRWNAEEGGVQSLECKV